MEYDGTYTVAKFNLNDYDYRIDPFSETIIITRKFDAQSWAASILQRYATGYYFADMGAGVVIARSRRELGGSVPHVGVAICNPKDKFCLDVGKAIAICRAEGITIPSKI